MVQDAVTIARRPQPFDTVQPGALPAGQLGRSWFDRVPLSRHPGHRHRQDTERDR
jgi:hypothetical protein